MFLCKRLPRMARWSDGMMEWYGMRLSRSVFSAFALRCTYNNILLNLYIYSFVLVIFATKTNEKKKRFYGIPAATRGRHTPAYENISHLPRRQTERNIPKICYKNCECAVLDSRFQAPELPYAWTNRAQYRAHSWYATHCHIMPCPKCQVSQATRFRENSLLLARVVECTKPPPPTWPQQTTSNTLLHIGKMINTIAFCYAYSEKIQIGENIQWWFWVFGFTKWKWINQAAPLLWDTPWIRGDAVNGQSLCIDHRHNTTRIDDRHWVRGVHFRQFASLVEMG